MDQEIQEFYITFGVQFSRHPGSEVHPLGMVKEGYAVIEAPDMDIARKIAYAVFGHLYAFIRDKEEFIDGGIAAKWHHEGELMRIAWVQKGSQDEYTRMMVARVDEAEGIVDQIKAIRSNFPEKCDVHDDDDITCGWKHMIAGIDEVLK